MSHLNVDLVIVNAKIYYNGFILEGGIAVDDGKIVAIGKEPNLPRGDLIVKAYGRLVIPGLIDAHVHFRDPGFTHKEDFITGSLAAAMGGVTTIIDEPNTKPSTINLDFLDQKIEMANEKSYVDYSFSFGLTPNNLDEISAVVDRGIASFDIFSEGLEKKDTSLNPGFIVEALTKIRNAGAVACLTNGEPNLNKWFLRKIQEEGGKDIAAYGEASPDIVEVIGIARNIIYADYLGVDVHLRQISSAHAVRVLRRLNRKDIKVTSEVSPHHLLLDTEYSKSLGPFGKVVPPIRTKDDVESVWSAFADGTIDIVATDHAPHTKEEKEIGWNIIWDAPSGLPGVETLLPLMLTQVQKERLSLQRMVEATSEIPAKIFRLYPRKGAILIGSDADLVLVNLKRKELIRGEILHSKIDWTPFEKWKVKGIPIMTIVRGKKVMEDGEIMCKQGHGNFVESNALNNK